MNVEHERALVLRGRVPSALVAEVPHRTHGILLRVVLFALTCVGLLAFTFFLDVAGVPRQGIVAGALALGAAEFLIRDRKWFWTGVEEALWIGGIFAWITELPRSGTPESNLVLALGAGLAGARVRNPLFGALSAICVVVWFEKRFDLGVVAALVFAAIAVALLLRTWRRPSTEWLWIAIAIILPAAGRFLADDAWRHFTIALYAAFGLAVFALAIVRRRHAFFLSGGIALGIAAVDAARLFVAVPLEAKFAAGGAVLLIAAWVLSRVLRNRTTGFVTTYATLTPVDEELRIAATIALPQAELAPKSEPAPTGGGEFGGAGATGKF